MFPKMAFSRNGLSSFVGNVRATRHSCQQSIHPELRPGDYRSRQSQSSLTRASSDPPAVRPPNSPPLPPPQPAPHPCVGPQELCQYVLRPSALNPFAREKNRLSVVPPLDPFALLESLSIHHADRSAGTGERPGLGFRVEVLGLGVRVEGLGPSRCANCPWRRRSPQPAS